MRITDLAEGDVPGIASQDIIGIRPGEKLHEVMVTESDEATQYPRVQGRYFAIMPSRGHYTSWDLRTAKARAHLASGVDGFSPYLTASSIPIATSSAASGSMPTASRNRLSE